MASAKKINLEKSLADLEELVEELESGDEHEQAQVGLRARYPQLVAMRIEELPVVAIRIEHAASWGNLGTQERL